MTPDKINAVAVIKQLLERITQRQAQLDELWRQRKTVLEQNMQVKSFEKSVYKVRGWLKTRGEDMVVTQADIGTSVESVQAILEHHEKSEGKARVSREGGEGGRRRRREGEGRREREGGRE